MRVSYNGRHLYHSVEGLQHLEPASKSVYDPHKYGLPDLKKYPMPDESHVRSAIKFFNYVSPKNEKRLAKMIIRRMKEYGIEDVNVGPNNRFGKYYKSSNVLSQHDMTAYDCLIHSTGAWEKHNYVDKVLDPNGNWRYIYDTAQQVGTRLSNVASNVANTANAYANKYGVTQTANSLRNSTLTTKSEKDLTPVQEAQHEKAVRIHNNLKSALTKTVSSLTGKSSSDSKSEDSTDSSTTKSSKGSSSKKSSSSKLTTTLSKISSNPGKAKGSSASSSSPTSTLSDATSEAGTKLSAAAKKAQKLAKEKAEEAKAKAEKAKAKATEIFNKKKEANEKKAAAEAEVKARRNATDTTTLSNDQLESVINLLSDENKAKARKLLETKATSAIDVYKKYVEDQAKNYTINTKTEDSDNKTQSDTREAFRQAISKASGMKDTGRTTISNDTLKQIQDMLDESKKKQAQSLLEGKTKLDDYLEQLRSRKA